MKRILTIIALTASALTFAACQPNRGGGDVVAAPPAPIPAPAPGYIFGTNPNRCALGQVDATAAGYGCLNRQSCNFGYGWLPSEARCVPGRVIDESGMFGGTAMNRFFGSMSISNRAQFELLLKYAHLCDPYWVGWNWGTYNCKKWSDQGFIELRTFGNATHAVNANMFIGAGSGTAGYVSSWMTSYQLSNSSPYIGFSQMASVVDHNSSAGMQIISVGPSGQDIGLRLIVNAGRLTDNSFSAQVQYQNVIFATVNFVRQ